MRVEHLQDGTNVVSLNIGPELSVAAYALFELRPSLRRKERKSAVRLIQFLGESLVKPKDLVVDLRGPDAELTERAISYLAGRDPNDPDDAWSDSDGSPLFIPRAIQMMKTAKALGEPGPAARLHVVREQQD